jgi:hypothetical protein
MWISLKGPGSFRDGCPARFTNRVRKLDRNRDGFDRRGDISRGIASGGYGFEKLSQERAGRASKTAALDGP